MMITQKKTAIFCILAAILTTMSACAGGCQEEDGTIASGRLRAEVYALVSSAENSSTAFWEQYDYIEDIGDGRGYTAGIIGFTTGTGDLLDVVRAYTELKPENNPLEQYIPALERVVWTDSHQGLDPDFTGDWITACQDEEMIHAQERIVDEQYMDEAIRASSEDGLSPLGQYIYYDALVVHGPGDTWDSFGGIRTAALRGADPPAKGGDETEYLVTFLYVRTQVMRSEEAHSDLSRINAQLKFLKEQNFDLELPLEWTMYGDSFTLTQEDVEQGVHYIQR